MNDNKTRSNENTNRYRLKSLLAHPLKGYLLEGLDEKLVVLMDAKDEQIKRLEEENKALRHTLGQPTLSARTVARTVEAEKKVKKLEEELRVVNMISDSFWRARKLLNLPTINVQDPGADITAEVERLKKEIEGRK